MIHLLRQACGALAEAHDAGLIHRDIKPGNLFLCRRPNDPDFLKVLDFGLVKDLRAQGDGADKATGTHTFIGTPLYVAPESLSADRQLDARSDIYALGAVAYRLLTGATVFEGTTAIAIGAHHLLTAPTPPSQRLGSPLPEDLEALVLRCLRKDPAERCAHAIELADALEACARRSPWSRRDAEVWWEQRSARIERARHARRRQLTAPASIVLEPEARKIASAVTELAPE